MEIKRQLRTYSFFLMSIVLLQSCVVYHKTPVSLEEAADQKVKTKIILKDKNVEKFKYITKEESQYYGTRLTGEGTLNISIDSAKVSEVRIKNKTASVIVTVVPLAAVTALLIAVLTSSYVGL